MKTIGMARLGKDAEVRYTPSGDAVCNLALAVNYGQKQQDGNRPTQWIDASLWGKRAESLAQYLTKGSVHCFTLDDVHIETYEGQNGTGYKLVARVADIELGPRAMNGGGQGQQQGQQQRQAPPQQSQQQVAPPPAQQQRQAPPQQQRQNLADMDDDK